MKNDKLKICIVGGGNISNTRHIPALMKLKNVEIFGVLSDSQNQYDMSLLGMLFGKDADSMRMILNGCKESGNFLELLDLYSPDGAKSLDKLREQQYKHGGIV